MSKTEFLREIYKKYGLTEDDVFKLHGTAIITKTGIQKIMTSEGFEYDYEVIVASPEYCAVKCHLSKDGEQLAVSMASAEKANVRNAQKYYLEMAEKRAKARAILIAIDAHGYLYSEDESDDFKSNDIEL